MNHRGKVFTFGGTSWFRARLCLGELNPPRHPSPPEPTEQTFGSHRATPSTTLQSFPTGMWSSVASASFAAPRRTSTHGHQRRIPTRACTFFAPLRTRVRTSKDWCRRNPLLTIGTSMPAFASDRYPMPIHNPIDREASWRGHITEKPLTTALGSTPQITEGQCMSKRLQRCCVLRQRGQCSTKKRPDASGRVKFSINRGEHLRRCSSTVTQTIEESKHSSPLSKS
jgi:hypothetical protein